VEGTSISNACYKKKRNRNRQILDYKAFVRPVLQYGFVCWERYREEQIIALGGVKKKAVQFTNHAKDSDRENLVQRRMIARL
jgi:hypothetical protein